MRPGLLFLKPKDALIMAANMGGDTDTVAKLVGDLVGATHGTEWIPEEAEPRR